MAAAAPRGGGVGEVSRLPARPPPHRHLAEATAATPAEPAASLEPPTPGVGMSGPSAAPGGGEAAAA